jgi:Na+-driven multidrug efflux pump
MRKGKEALYLVGLSVALNVAVDLFLISNLSFSLQLGTNGVAIGYIISKVVLFAASITYAFRILGISPINFLRRVSLKNQFKPLFRIGKWTGLDSLVRNLGYMGQLTVLNVIGESQYGGYGLAMWVMWTLLIPVLAIGQGTSVAVGNLYGERRYRDMNRVLLTSIIISALIMVGIAIVGVFYWENISTFFNNNPQMVSYSVATFWWLIIPYVLFGIGNTVKSLFFGTGFTKYVFLISCVANFLLIGPFLVLANAGWFVATYDSVMELFFVVFVEDLIVTAFVALRLERRITNFRNI